MADGTEDQTVPGPAPAMDYPEMVEVDPGHYVVADEIARGGMGRIRVAHDRRLGRRIALKEILTQQADVARRFEREARITARLEHPSIVSVHEAGAWPTGEPFIAMRLVRGRSFDEVIDEAKTLEARMALLPNVLAVADAIAYAHEQQVVHRDLKPKNVLVGKFGETVVIDWGLAKDHGDTEAGTKQGNVLPVGYATRGSSITGTESTIAAAPAITGTEATIAAPSKARTPASTITGNEATIAPPVTGMEETLAPSSAGTAPTITGTEATIAASTKVTFASGSGRPSSTIVDDAALTMDGAVMGTPGYMPPEQARGEPVDARADVYAIGAMLYHVLAGEPPIRAKTVADALALAMTGTFTPLSERGLDIPPDLLAIADKAMAKDAADRYPSARELAEDLRRYQTGQLVGAHRYSVGELVRKWLRRHRGLVAISAVALAVVAVMGVISVRRIMIERERADAARAVAVKNRGDAEALVSFMLGDIRKQLEMLGRLDVLETVTVRSLDYYEKSGDSLDQLGKHATALMLYGSVLEAKGNLAAGVARVQEATVMRAALRRLRPGAIPELRDLAGSERKLSDMLRRQGDLAGSLAAARIAVEVIDEAAKSGTTDRDLQRDIQRDLAGAHRTLGGVLRATGDMDGALTESKAALQIREVLAKAAPDDLELQRDLAIGHERVAEIYQAQENLDGALEELRASLAIAERAVARDPKGNRERRRDLSVLHWRIGDLLVAKEDVDGALASYRSAQDNTEALSSENPKNVQYQRDRSISHSNIGRALLKKGDRDGALVELRADLAIAAKLAAQDPTNAEWQRDLSVSHETVADVLLGAGDAAGALREMRASLAIAKRLAETDTTNQRWQKDLAGTYRKLAEVYTAAGDAAQAAAATKQAERLTPGTK